MLSVHNFRLIPLSPIHIGGKFQAISPFEYIVEGGKFRVIREEKLAGILQRRGLVSEFIRQFEQSGFSLGDYLRGRGLLSAQLVEELSLYSCSLIGGSPEGKQVRPFNRDAWQRPYIPGTAIKGAMRTALWYDAIKKNPNRWLDRLRRRVKSENRAKVVDDELDREILQGYKLENEEKSPHTDILRVIKVSDAKPWERDSLFVGEEVTFARGKPRPDLSIYLEYQGEAKETIFSVVFDEELFRRFKGGLLFNSFEDFLRKVDAFYRSVAEAELGEGEEKGRAFYQWLIEKTKGAGYLMRIGWGGGLSSLTIWLALPKDIRETIREKFFERSHREKFPLTRRFLKRMEKGGETYTPFGWVILKEVK